MVTSKSQKYKFKKHKNLFVRKEGKKHKKHSLKNMVFSSVGRTCIIICKGWSSNPNNLLVHVTKGEFLSRLLDKKKSVSTTHHTFKFENEFDASYF